MAIKETNHVMLMMKTYVTLENLEGLGQTSEVQGSGWLVGDQTIQISLGLRESLKLKI